MRRNDRNEGERRRTIDPLAKLPHSPDLPDDPRLSKDVIILYPVQQLAQTPERIRFDRVEDLGGEEGDVVGLWIGFCVVHCQRSDEEVAMDEPI